jgi:hypothetical protein
MMIYKHLVLGLDFNVHKEVACGHIGETCRRLWLDVYFMVVKLLLANTSSNKVRVRTHMSNVTKANYTFIPIWLGWWNSKWYKILTNKRGQTYLSTSQDYFIRNTIYNPKCWRWMISIDLYVVVGLNLIVILWNTFWLWVLSNFVAMQFIWLWVLKARR